MSDSPVLPGAFPARLISAAAQWVWRRLQLARDPPVEQLHLAYGQDAAHEVALSWVTPLPVPSPFVEVEHLRTRAETSCYPCYPGYVHHARLSGLSSATRYTYRVGHAGRVVSTESRFRTGPVGRARFASTAFGDLGTDRPPPGPRTLRLFDRFEVDLVLQGHDHAYERNHPISEGEIVTDQTPYVCEKGTFYVTCGNAGTVLPSYPRPPPRLVRTRQDRHVGAVRVEVDPFAPGRSRRLVVTAHHLGGEGEPEPAVIERPVTRTPTQRHVVGGIEGRHCSSNAARRLRDENAQTIRSG